MTMVSTEANTRPYAPSLEQSDKPKPTTEEVIIRGSDVLPAEVRSDAEIVHDGVESALEEVRGWITWKVKNELILQLVENSKSGQTQINTDLVSEIILKEMLIEKEKHLENALYLENDVIPIALIRQAEPQSATQYWFKDVPNLHLRAAVHYEAFNRITGMEPKDEEGLEKLTEAYIKPALIAAYPEVYTIMAQKNQELQAEVLALEAAAEVAVVLKQAEEEEVDQELLYYESTAVKSIAA